MMATHVMFNLSGGVQLMNRIIASLRFGFQSGLPKSPGAKCIRGHCAGAAGSLRYLMAPADGETTSSAEDTVWMGNGLPEQPEAIPPSPIRAPRCVPKQKRSNWTSRSARLPSANAPQTFRADVRTSGLASRVGSLAAVRSRPGRRDRPRDGVGPVPARPSSRLAAARQPGRGRRGGWCSPTWAAPTARSSTAGGSPADPPGARRPHRHRAVLAPSSTAPRSSAGPGRTTSSSPRAA